MSAIANPLLEQPRGWVLPDRGKVAMASLIIAESAIFTIFVVAYLFYLGKSVSGPTPKEVLETPIFFTVCLLSSSMVMGRCMRSSISTRVSCRVFVADDSSILETVRRVGGNGAASCAPLFATRNCMTGR